MQHAGSLVLNQGSDLRPLQWSLNNWTTKSLQSHTLDLNISLNVVFPHCLVMQKFHLYMFSQSLFI